MSDNLKKITIYLVLHFLLCISLALHAKDLQVDAQIHTQGQFISLNFHDVRNDVAVIGDRDTYAINSQNLAKFFAWLSHSNWHVIRLEDVWLAHQYKKPLPDRAVLLTFDDGALSSYTQVYPLLKQYQLPAVFAIVTSWTNGNTHDPYEAYGQGNLMNWRQIQEMKKSGWAEFVSHSDNLHKGILANPQQNMEPSAITREYLATQHRYESDKEYHLRILNDLKKSKRILDEKLDNHTKAIFWPYGAVTKETEQIAKEAGLPLSFSLGNDSIQTADVDTYQRSIVMSNPTTEDIHAQMLDFLKDANKPSTERRTFLSINPEELLDQTHVLNNDQLGQLLNQLSSFKNNIVTAQVVAAPNQMNQITRGYFPTSATTHYSDALNRIVWQAKTRIGQTVYAEIPLNMQAQTQLNLVQLTADLLKNNSSLDGLILNLSNNMDCVLNAALLDSNCFTHLEQQFQLSDQLFDTAKKLVNISTNFQTVIQVKPERGDMQGLTQLLQMSLKHSDLVYFELDPLQQPHIFETFKNTIQRLDQTSKYKIWAGFDVSAKLDNDWFIYKTAYQQLKALGVQKLGIANYHLRAGQGVQKYLYSELSLNDAPLEYTNPYQVPPALKQKQ